MQRFLASVICLLGLSGCVYPGFTLTPTAPEKEPLYYVPPVVNRNEPQLQQPLIVPQYVPVPQPYPYPMNGYGMQQGNPYMQQNPYAQQMAQKKMDTLSQNYTAHNLNVARQVREEIPPTMLDADNAAPTQYIILKNPHTQDTVQCQRADYPCVYAYEAEGYTRIERRSQLIQQPRQSVQPVQQLPTAQIPTNTIPRW